MEQIHSGTKPVTVALELSNPDAAIGVVPNDKLVVVRVQQGSPADGKLLVGDKIVKVNDVAVADRQQLTEQLARVRPSVRLLLWRPAVVPLEICSLQSIPAERAKNITPRDGFTYILVRIDWPNATSKLGLGVKDYQNRVLVSRCDKGSLSAQCLRIGDRIIDVGGTPVSNKDVCRDLVVSALVKTRVVSLAVERPFTASAAQKAKADLVAASEMSPSVPMNSDVREIASKQKERYKGPVNAVRGMVVTDEVTADKRVTIAEGAPEVIIIASDCENKKLRQVKRRK